MALLGRRVPANGDASEVVFGVLAVGVGDGVYSVPDKHRMC